LKCLSCLWTNDAIDLAVEVTESQHCGLNLLHYLHELVGVPWEHIRSVPLLPSLMAEVVRHFGLRRLQQDAVASARRPFPWSRVTAWRIIKTVMAWAGISGIKACPKGFRHAFGIRCLTSGVPITLVQRWMGHARLSTTAIYLNVCGPEEVFFASLLWEGPRQRPRPYPAFFHAMVA